MKPPNDDFGRDLVGLVHGIAWLTYIGFGLVLLSHSLSLSFALVVIITVGLLWRILTLWHNLEMEYMRWKDNQPMKEEILQAEEKWGRDR